MASDANSSNGTATSRFARNLAEAWLAVHYVQKEISLGASNRERNGVGDKLKAAVGFVTLMAGRPIVYVGSAVMSASEDHYALRGKVAKFFSAGNCSEQASLAFVFLRDRVRPVELMSMDTGDHQFVVIGRVKDSNAGQVQEWGPEAVVCDPWKQKAFPAAEFYLHTGKGQYPESDCRLE